MNRVGYYNGEIAPVEELKIPALDRACYFGDGVYYAIVSHILWYDDVTFITNATGNSHTFAIIIFVIGNGIHHKIVGGG